MEGAAKPKQTKRQQTASVVGNLTGLEATTINPQVYSTTYPGVWTHGTSGIAPTVTWQTTSSNATYTSAANVLP